MLLLNLFQLYNNNISSFCATTPTNILRFFFCDTRVKNLRTSTKLSTSNFGCMDKRHALCFQRTTLLHNKELIRSLVEIRKKCAEELRVIKLSMKNLKCLTSFIFSLYIFLFLNPLLSLLSSFYIPRSFIFVFDCV